MASITPLRDRSVANYGQISINLEIFSKISGKKYNFLHKSDGKKLKKKKIDLLMASFFFISLDGV